jgi:hypothetical protein
MPRKPRLDAESALHHVMARGIERRSIFKDDGDRERFIERLGLLAAASQASDQSSPSLLQRNWAFHMPKSDDNWALARTAK